MSKFFKSLLLLLSVGLFTATGWAETITVNQETIGINFSRKDAALSTTSNDLYGYQSGDGKQGGLLEERAWQSFYAPNNGDPYGNPFVTHQAYEIVTAGNPALDVTLTKKSDNNVWGPNEYKLFGSYLDNGSILEFNGLPTSGYDVAIIFAGDGNSGSFSCVTVNGIDKTYDDESGTLTGGSSAWGRRSTCAAGLMKLEETGTATKGQVMYLADMNTETLTLQTYNNDPGKSGRGTIAAIQIYIKSGTFETNPTYTVTDEGGSWDRTPTDNASVIVDFGTTPGRSAYQTGDDVTFSVMRTIGDNGGTLAKSAESKQWKANRTIIRTDTTVNVGAASLGAVTIDSGRTLTVKDVSMVSSLGGEGTYKLDLGDTTVDGYNFTASGRNCVNYEFFSGKFTNAVFGAEDFKKNYKFTGAEIQISSDFDLGKADLSVSNGEISANRLRTGTRANNRPTNIDQTEGTIKLSNTGYDEGGAAIILGHWRTAKAEYTISGGELNAEKGGMIIGFTSPATLNIRGGLVKVKGIRGHNEDFERKLNLSGGTLSLGSGNLGDENGEEIRQLTFTMSGGKLNAYEDAKVNQPIVLTEVSSFSADEGETLTIASTISGSDNLTIFDNLTIEGAGVIDLSKATVTNFTGSYSVTNKATLILTLAQTANKTITVEAGATLKVKLFALDALSPQSVTTTGGGKILFVDADGNPLAEADGATSGDNAYTPATPTWKPTEVNREWTSLTLWSTGVVPTSGAIAIDTSAMEAEMSVEIPSSFNSITVKGNVNNNTEVTFADGVTVTPSLYIGGRVKVTPAVINGLTAISFMGDNAVLVANVTSDADLTKPLSGNFKFEKVGDGTLTLKANVSPEQGSVIAKGIVKFEQPIRENGKVINETNAFGSAQSNQYLGATGDVLVKAKAELDVNGHTGAWLRYVTLEKDAVFANRAGAVGNTERQCAGIILDGDATVHADTNFGILAGGYAVSKLELNGHILTKTGDGSFWLANTDVAGEGGTLKVEKGKFEQVETAPRFSNIVFDSADSDTAFTLGTGDVTAPVTKKGTGAMTIGGDISGSGAVTVEAGTLILTGTNTYNGATTIKADATLKVNGTAAGTVVLPEGETVTVMGRATVDLVQGLSYVTITGDGTTKVTGTYTYGIGNVASDLTTKTVEITDSGVLQFRNWKDNYTFNVDNLTVNGILKNDGYKDDKNEAKPILGVNINKALAGSGTIEVPVTLANNAIIDTTARTLTANGTVNFGETLNVKVSGDDIVGTQILKKADANIIEEVVVENVAVVVNGTEGYCLAQDAEGYVLREKVANPEVSATVPAGGTTSLSAALGENELAANTILTINFGDGTTPGIFTFDNDDDDISFAQIIVKGTNGGTIEKTGAGTVETATTTIEDGCTVTVPASTAVLGAVDIETKATLSVADTATVTSVTGEGTLETSVYPTTGPISGYAAPLSIAGLTDDAWTGTLCFNANGEITQNGLRFDLLGNADSTIEIATGTSVVGYLGLNNNNGWTADADLVLNGTLHLNNGFSGRTYVFNGVLTGSGTLKLTAAPTDRIYFAGEVSGFTGALKLESSGRAIVIGPTSMTDEDGKIVIAGTAKLGAGWTATNGIVIKDTGSLDINGQNLTVTELTSAGTITDTAETTGAITVNGGAVNVTGSCAVPVTVDLSTYYSPTTFVVPNGTTFNTTGKLIDYLTYDENTKTISAIALTTKLDDELIWLPVGDSITEGEQHMGHADRGDTSSRGGYRYQLWKLMEELGQQTRSVGFRTGHCTTPEVPATTDWAWHAALYGGAIKRVNGDHGGQWYNVESALETAGYPDVITVLLGINDLSWSGEQDGIEKIYEDWTAMVEKYATLRPHSKILVSTLLPVRNGNASDVRFGPFNVLMRADANATPKRGAFKYNNVIFTDVCLNAFNDAYDSAYFKDQVHPNETGSVKVASAFHLGMKDVLAAITNDPLKIVHAHNAVENTLTVRLNKAIESVANLTATITGTNFAGETVNVSLSGGTLDENNKRVITFALTDDLVNGDYTVSVNGTVNGDALASALTATGATVEILGTGAAQNVKPAFLEGFKHRKTITLGGNTANYAEGAHEAVDGANVGDSVEVGRVGYYMELQRAGAPAQFVWVSMNAFDNNEAKLGIPTADTGAHKAIVSGLNVFANRGNFAKEIKGGTGVVEFTPWGWTAEDQEAGTTYPVEGQQGYYGWNDTLETLETTTRTLKGCMQIARITDPAITSYDWQNPAAEMLFAYNNFNCDTMTDVGIGSFVTHHSNAGATSGKSATPVFDWTDFSSMTQYTTYMPDAYEVKKIELWVAPALEEVSELTIDATECATWSEVLAQLDAEGKMPATNPSLIINFGDGTTPGIFTFDLEDTTALSLTKVTIQGTNGGTITKSGTANVTATATVVNTNVEIAKNAMRLGQTTLAANCMLTVNDANALGEAANFAADATSTVKLVDVDKDTLNLGKLVPNGSNLILKNVKAYIYDCTIGTLTLEGNFQMNNGTTTKSKTQCVTVNNLAGVGTFIGHQSAEVCIAINVKSWTNFTGSIDLSSDGSTNTIFFFGEAPERFATSITPGNVGADDSDFTDADYGTLYVTAGKTLATTVGTTWHLRKLVVETGASMTLSGTSTISTIAGAVKLGGTLTMAGTLPNLIVSSDTAVLNANTDLTVNSVTKDGDDACLTLESGNVTLTSNPTVALKLQGGALDLSAVTEVPALTVAADAEPTLPTTGITIASLAVEAEKTLTANQNITVTNTLSGEGVLAFAEEKGLTYNSASVSTSTFAGVLTCDNLIVTKGALTLAMVEDSEAKNVLKNLTISGTQASKAAVKLERATTISGNAVVQTSGSSAEGAAQLILSNEVVLESGAILTLEKYAMVDAVMETVVPVLRVKDEATIRCDGEKSYTIACPITFEAGAIVDTATYSKGGGTEKMNAYLRYTGGARNLTFPAEGEVIFKIKYSGMFLVVTVLLDAETDGLNKQWSEVVTLQDSDGDPWPTENHYIVTREMYREFQVGVQEAEIANASSDLEAYVAKLAYELSIYPTSSKVTSVANLKYDTCFTGYGASELNNGVLTLYAAFGIGNVTILPRTVNDETVQQVAVAVKVEDGKGNAAGLRGGTEIYLSTDGKPRDALDKDWKEATALQDVELKAAGLANGEGIYWYWAGNLPTIDGGTTSTTLSYDVKAVNEPTP